jgi:ectoine hydroxylase-related dioxygenase (phytanoyl-CoA dioxygenase family)
MKEKHMNDGISIAAAAEPWTQTLLSDGYCIIQDALPSDLIRSVDEELAVHFQRTPFCRGGFYGETTKRVGRVLIRSANAASMVQHRLILEVARKVLSPWCDTIQLNVAQAIAIHPGAPPQLPHRDQDMWRGLVGTDTEYLLNVMWPLTEFTRENGATLIWPNSHGANALEPEPAGEAVAVAMSPGSALLFLGSTLHGAGANRSCGVRRGLVVGYSLGWLKPYENPWLSYPPEIARDFPIELAQLVGYQQHRPNLGNFEGQCPSVLLGEPVSQPLGAVDALRPDQEALMSSFLAGQARAL